MATIDFPSSPTMGQEYPFGDFIYVWDGVKWTTKVIVGEASGGSNTYVSEVAPAGANPGSTWYCTANGLTYILYNDGDSTQWVEANPNYPQVDSSTVSKEYTDLGDKLHTSLPFDFAFNVGWQGGAYLWEDTIDAPAGYPCPKLAVCRDTRANDGSSFRSDINVAAEYSILAGEPFMDGGKAVVVIDTEGVGNVDIDFYIMPIDADGNDLGNYHPEGHVDVALPAGANDTQHREFIITMFPDPEAVQYRFRFRFGTPNGAPFEGTVKVGIGAGNEWILQHTEDNFVKKAGDVMTGRLAIHAPGKGMELHTPADTASYIVSYEDEVANWYVGKGGTNDDIRLLSYAYDNFVELAPDHIMLEKEPRTNSIQGTNASSLTRKDYVDASIPTRKKSEIHWTGLNTVLVAGTPVNIITLLNGTLATSGSWAPMFNPTTGKLTPFNDDRTVTFKLNLIGSFAGGSTNRALQLDFFGTVGNRLVVMRDSNISPSPNSIQFSTFFSVDKDGNMALNGTEPLVTALGGDFTITEALIIAEQVTTEG